MAFKQLKLWFDGELAQMLGDAIKRHHPDFDLNGFVGVVNSGVDNLELKDRVEFIADQLHYFVPGDYTYVADTIISILGPENEEETGMFTNFYWVMPLAKYVEKFGLHDLSTSFHLLEEITKRNTSEYAIRPYLEQYPAETLLQVEKWSKSPNFHVRRLASEGIRPRLPWATKLQSFIDDPKPILPILNTLKDDPKKYVQKSVANCLNDILKDNHEIGKSVIESWLETTPITKPRQWIIKHALRVLKKKEDTWALSLISTI